MSAAETLEELAERADQHLRAALAPPSLTVARALFNEARLNAALTELDKARKILGDAPDVVAHAKEQRQTAKETLAHRRDEYAQAVAEAEWALSVRVARDGNKTYIVTRYHANDERPDDAVPVDGAPDVWEQRRQVTADQADTWRKQAAAKNPNVVRSVAAVQAAEHALALCDIDVDRAEDRWQAARYLCDTARTTADAAIAHLNCLARSLEGARS